MANTRVTHGSSSTAKIMMAVALVAILGLMAYLAVASKASAPPPAPMEDGVAGDAGAVAPAIAAATFGGAIQNYVGQEIDLQGVSVVQLMSPQIFWIDVPTPQGNTPFPVKLASGVAAPAAGSMVNIEGRVLQKTDSVVAAWETSGAIQDAGQKAQVEYGTYYIEARAVRPGGA